MSRTRPSKWRVALTAGRLAGRRISKRQVSARDLELGELLTGQLDQMKGLAMKMGQIVSYMDIPLPEEVLIKLAGLQTGKLGMPGEQVREVVEAALGASIEECFDAFDFEPVAAASIGQVHRARLGHQRVAVKVQYPDVAGSFDEDLGFVNRVASLASLASAVDGRMIVGELGQRLHEECDYAREAEMQRRFAAAFSRDRSVRVPAILAAHSASTVMTSAWAEGEDFETLCAAEPERRNAAARVLLRFSYRSLLELALIQADPHPGNFLFGSDGQVVFLDFGCVRALEPSFVQALRDQITAVRDNDRVGFKRAVQELGLVGNPRKFDFDHFFKVMGHLYRPLIAPEFQFTKEYVREGLDFNGPQNPNARTLAIPGAYVWVMRLQWGLWSIFAKLRAEGAFSQILDAVLATEIRPLRD